MPPTLIDLSMDSSDDEVDGATSADLKRRRDNTDDPPGRGQPWRDPSVSLLSPLDPDELTPPQCAYSDFPHLVTFLESSLVEPHTPGYALYALGIRDAVRQSPHHLLRPRKTEDHFNDYIHLVLPRHVLLEVYKVVDLVAACIWGRLRFRSSNRPVRLPTPSDLIPVSESVALRALVKISIHVADMQWGQHTPYAVHAVREDIYEQGFDHAPTLQLGDAGLGDDQICGICRHVKSYSVLFNCGHSFCHICSRLSFNGDFECASCGALQYGPPLPYLAEREKIRQLILPAVDESRIRPTWDGIRFPQPRRKRVTCVCGAVAMCQCLTCVCGVAALCHCPRVGATCTCIAASVCRCLAESTPDGVE
ncbi:hypothetical protein C8F01DRAFT_1176377 [Mycena amicta]|nr:hypothetical protein C8F01DRAFT_1176377 [Mycena amicta]